MAAARDSRTHPVRHLPLTCSPARHRGLGDDLDRVEGRAHHPRPGGHGRPQRRQRGDASRRPVSPSWRLGAWFRPATPCWCAGTAATKMHVLRWRATSRTTTVSPPEGEVLPRGCIIRTSSPTADAQVAGRAAAAQSAGSRTLAEPLKKRAACRSICCSASAKS